MIFRHFAVFSLSLLLTACSGKDDDSAGTSGVDLEGPALAHTPPDAVAEGVEVSLSLSAVDPEGMGSVSLYHRSGGVTSWTLLPMAAAGADSYTATIAADDVDSPTLEYYFKASDDGETPALSYLPAEETTESPFSVPVTVEGAPLPYFEDFEADDGVSASDLSTLGWGAASTRFQGYPWQISQTEVYSGGNSAYHPQGYDEAEASEDWLVSPAIDLTTADTVQVTWQEYGNSTEAANHGLYISTGGRDPADGDYTLVTALPAPLEDAWGRSQIIDLAAYAGNTVYLAWYFEGTGADDWYVDDIRVEGLQADLYETWVIDPSPVHPGESTTLTVTVTNTATVDASDVSVDLAFPDGGATGDAASVTLGEIAAGGTATAEFTVSVDAAQADNRYVPMDIGVVWGSSERVTSEQFLVGYASTASVDWTTDAEGSLEIVVGVGDPDAPDWSTTLYADNAIVGDLALSADITEAGDFLPPAAGPLRWWAQATTVGGGSFGDFQISYGGEDFVATGLPSVSAGSTELCWVPEPPDFTVSGRTDPTTLAPGDSGVRIALTVKDTGATTSGPVIAMLSSSDAHVNVTDPGPLTISNDVMDRNDTYTITGFAFDVSSTHTDSTDVALQVTLDDGVESWLYDLSFDVPYPVFTVTSIEIDDDGGDGLLDPDESGTLTINLTNTGDINASGTVSGVMSVAGTSVALAEVPTDSEVFGSIASGSTADARFDVAVTGGAAGDPLDLELALFDSSRTYSASTQLFLSEPPWSSLSTEDDAEGDTVDGWEFDVKSGSYRVIDGVMQIRISSYEPLDAGTLFVEAWGYSIAGDYDYYRLVAQSGNATLQGYLGGFTSLPDPTLSYPDANTVQFDFPLSDLGLFSDSLNLGFASGWCGEPEYFCDHFPDGWGYPYDEVNGWNPALWLELEW